MDQAGGSRAPWACGFCCLDVATDLTFPDAWDVKTVASLFEWRTGPRLLAVIRCCPVTPKPVLTGLLFSRWALGASWVTLVSEAGSQAGTDLSPILTRGGKSSVNNLADHQPVNERNGSQWVKAQLKSEYEANG